MNKIILNKEIGNRLKMAINYIVYLENFDNRNQVSSFLKRDSTNLSKAISGNMSYAKTFIDDICKKYSFFNMEWFYDGKGDMNIQKSEIIIKEIDSIGCSPFYGDMPVCAGQLELIESREIPTGYIKIPGVQAKWFFPVIGYSMLPIIKQGDIIGVEDADKNDLFDPENIYLIITNENRMIKHIRKDEKDNSIIWCISPNYKEIKLYINDIKYIYKVVFHGELM